MNAKRQTAAVLAKARRRAMLTGSSVTPEEPEPVGGDHQSAAGTADSAQTTDTTPAALASARRRAMLGLKESN
ncbi:hypothetical protein [Micromonospora zamorensis]|uniref:Uncharacterized protein n=1 Tax=Micromonospora zamorensis TaxID=709883 RepID=A0ABZ1P9S6_9ACTN